MTDIVKEMEEDNKRMSDAVDKLTFITHMVANYYEICPHCLAHCLAGMFSEEENEDAGE